MFFFAGNSFYLLADSSLVNALAIKFHVIFIPHIIITIIGHNFFFLLFFQFRVQQKLNRVCKYVYLVVMIIIIGRLAIVQQYRDDRMTILLRVFFSLKEGVTIDKTICNCHQKICRIPIILIISYRWLSLSNDIKHGDSGWVF